MSLRGRAVVVTRPRHQAPALVGLLREYGARTIEYPVVEVAPVGGEAAEAVRRGAATLARGGYDGLIVTSANAVRLLAPFLREAAVSALGAVFAVGPKTAAAIAALSPAMPATVHVARTSAAEGVVELLGEAVPHLTGRRFFFPRARGGRPAIVDALRAAGAEVDAPELYETVTCDGPPLTEVGGIDWLTFTSPSAVRGFAARNPGSMPAARVACIGPTTADAARAHGMGVHVVPAEQTIEAMVAAMHGSDAT